MEECMRYEAAAPVHAFSGSHAISSCRRICSGRELRHHLQSQSWWRNKRIIHHPPHIHFRNKWKINLTVNKAHAVCSYPARMLMAYGIFTLNGIQECFRQASEDTLSWQVLLSEECCSRAIENFTFCRYIDASQIMKVKEGDNSRIFLPSLIFGLILSASTCVQANTQALPRIVSQIQSTALYILCSWFLRKILLSCLVIFCLNTSPTLAGEIHVSPSHEEVLNAEGQSCMQNNYVYLLNEQMTDHFQMKDHFHIQVKNDTWYKTLLTNASFFLGVNDPFAPTGIFSMAEIAVPCKEAYGIFPCSPSLGGNLFLMLVYGYLLLNAAKLISNGSELLLEVMNPGLVGGLLLPILGALPDALLIFYSGSDGSIEEAKQEVMIGVGVLAGSTTTLLTIGWAGSLIMGRCDLGSDGTAEDTKLTYGLDLFKTGVTTDEQTRWGAWIMMASTLPLICVQVPLLDRHPAEGPQAALLGAIIAFVDLLAYCLYQVAYPWLQQKRIEDARMHLFRMSALQGITSFATKSILPESFLQEEVSGSSLNVLSEVFCYFDKNKDGKIQEEELQGLIVGLNLQEKGSMPAKEQVATWLSEFDSDGDGMLTENEFLSGIQDWARQVIKERDDLKVENLSKFFKWDDPDLWVSKLEEAKKVMHLLESEMGDSETAFKDGAEFPVQSSELYKRAVLCLMSGAVLASLFADPLIDSVKGVSASSSVSPFFIAFIVIPLASNASELFSSILSARRRQKRNISLTFSQLYGAVTMNNTLCLGIFLSIAYSRGLTWDFSSEVTVIVLNILCVGTIGVSRTTFPLWYSIPVLSLYPLSLGSVFLLDSVFGWQ